MPKAKKQGRSSRRSASKSLSTNQDSEPTSSIPNPMPSRPLNAYNFFFREQFAIITAEEADDDTKLETSPRFKKTGKAIAERWKTLRPTEHARFRDLAAAEQERYRREMEKYNLEIFRQMQHEAPSWRKDDKCKEAHRERERQVGTACPPPPQQQHQSLVLSSGRVMDATLDSVAVLQDSSRGPMSRTDVGEARKEYASIPTQDVTPFGATSRIANEVPLPFHIDIPHQLRDSGTVHPQYLRGAARESNFTFSPEPASNDTLRLHRFNETQAVYQPLSMLLSECSVYDQDVLYHPPTLSASQLPVHSNAVTLTNEQVAYVISQTAVLRQIADTLSLLLHLRQDSISQREMASVAAATTTTTTSSAYRYSTAPLTVAAPSQTTTPNTIQCMMNNRGQDNTTFDINNNNRNGAVLSNQNLFSAGSSRSQQQSIVPPSPPRNIQEWLWLILSALSSPPSNNSNQS